MRSTPLDDARGTVPRLPSENVISMDPQTTSIRRRLPAWWAAMRSAAVERMGQDEVRWRALGALFLAGGTLALVVLRLPTDPATRTGGVLAVALLAVLGGAIMIGAARHLPSGERWISGSLGAGTVLISVAVWFTQVPSAPFALLYVWVAFDGFCFLSRRAAFAHLGFLGLCYAVVLALLPASDDTDVGRWLMTMGTVAVVGLLADVMHNRSERLIEQLGRAASTDALTGLWNRRGFEHLMEMELARTQRTGRPMSMLIGDLDHFKSINDRFGHAEGDDVLRRFGALLTATLRKGDAAARIGGEEFAVILPGCDQHQALILAERLRRRVRAELVAKDKPVPISVSIGVASSPAHGTSPSELMHNADRGLYVAKHLGRDRCVVYSAELAASVSTPEHRAAPEQLSAVLVLAETLDLRDAGTAAHSQTVALWAQAIARRLALPAQEVERIRLAGLLHDIGKIGVPDAVLQKPGPLTDAEWAEMRKHPELGARILDAANLDDISGWVLEHHERPDGGGYPDGLHDTEISLEAKILAVADAFEAMTSDRVYRLGMPLRDAVDELRRCSGTQFSHRVVEALQEVLAAQASLPSSAHRSAVVAG